ncbi:dihydrofolate reductase [Anopheles sinensis]|uniref:Dihydrofolate reductase n=1 Tax=Anopheles sinensis TaxID=74873 RepID=A0A084VC83_ANOSI|nr:dihydrofolate reductase [Anopheles sinensis]
MSLYECKCSSLFCLERPQPERTTSTGGIHRICIHVGRCTVHRRAYESLGQRKQIFVAFDSSRWQQIGFASVSSNQRLRYTETGRDGVVVHTEVATGTRFPEMEIEIASCRQQMAQLIKVLHFRASFN